MKVGNELVCTDDKQYIFKVGHTYVVSLIRDDYICFKDCSIKYDVGVVKYFKKKEPVKEYDFNDLIDVAVQAKKDGLICGIFVIGEIIKCRVLAGDNEEYSLGVGDDVLGGINFLQSLYKETFVIETIEDMSRVSRDHIGCIDRSAIKSIRLSNGNVLNDDDISVIGMFINEVLFVYLKGATVEQSR